MEREHGVCKELLELEPEAKWPLLTLTRLQELRLQLQQQQQQHEGSAEAEAAAIQAGYEQLCDVDPMRRGYYADAAGGRAHVVAKPQLALP